MSNIRVIVTFEIQKKNQDYTITYLKEFGKQTRREPGNLSFEFLKPIDDSDIFAFVELWENEQAVLAHTQSDNFKNFAPFFAFNLKELKVKQMAQISCYD